MAGLPADTVAELEPPKATVRPKPDTPVPLNGTVCGLPGASSTIVKVPLRLPAAVGVNVTEIWHELEGFMEVPQLLLSAKSPEVAMRIIVTATPPVSVKVTACVELDVPMTWEPKVSEFGLMLSCGARPVPVRLTTCGLPGASSVMVIVPVLAPPAVGAKITDTMQFAAAARSCGHVLV